MTINSDVDVFGKAVQDYFYNKQQTEVINVESDITSDEEIPVAYLFRAYNEMPTLEKEALKLCKGKILDIGACAGSHSLYLQNKGLDVTAIDISPGCSKVIEGRGVRNVETKDFFEFELKDKPYDTLMLLMNGIGIAGNVEGLKILLLKAKTLLNKTGRILFDSSDIDYMFYEEDGSKWVDLNSDYYGELEYKISYKNIEGERFKWLFVDPEKIKEVATECGFVFRLIKKGEHYDYLGELTLA